MSAPKVDPTRMVDFFGTKVCTKFDTKFDTKFGTKGWSADNMVDFFGTAILCSDSSLVVPGYTKLFHKEPAYHNWSFSGKPNDLSSLLTLIKVCDLFFYFAFFFLFSSDKCCVPYNAYHICPQRGWKTVHLSFNTTFKNSAKWCLCQVYVDGCQINVKWRCLGGGLSNCWLLL